MSGFAACRAKSVLAGEREAAIAGAAKTPAAIKQTAAVINILKITLPH
jgi:hypothetical protein